MTSYQFLHIMCIYLKPYLQISRNSKSRTSEDKRQHRSGNHDKCGPGCLTHQHRWVNVAVKNNSYAIHIMYRLKYNSLGYELLASGVNLRIRPDIGTNCLHYISRWLIANKRHRGRSGAMAARLAEFLPPGGVLHARSDTSGCWGRRRVAAPFIWIARGSIRAAFSTLRARSGN